jgi:hypothetical protein
MKYIKLFENFNKFELEKELNKYDIKNYTINDDGTIDVNGSVNLSFSSSGIRLYRIPFKFGKVTGDFNVYNNELKSLEGSPYSVYGNFDCSRNNLTSLVGCPGEVGGDFECQDNNLESLEGMSLEIGGDFICFDNEFLTDIDSLSNIEGEIHCDDGVGISEFKGYCKKFVYY